MTNGWAREVASPRPLPGKQGFERCSEPDGALREVAARLAARASGRGEIPTGDELSYELRRAGDPHVWPHAWVATVRTDDPEAARSALERAAAATEARGVRRCGTAVVAPDRSTSVVAAVWVDALADLSPIPSVTPHARWIDFDARLLVPVSQAKLFVLPPHGAPFTVPTIVHGERVRAAVHADSPGAFRLQLVATLPGGPRPLLEATLFVESAPPATYEPEPVPGEDEAAALADPTMSLVAMTRAARRSESVPPLARSEGLDRIAEGHAAALLASGRLAHDIGGGDPAARVGALGISARYSGENVAHEATPLRAARALWASVSHRANILDPRFRTLGVGVAKDTDGSLWIAELFADYREGVIGAASLDRQRSFDDAPRD